MWQLLGTLAVSSVGGAFFLHYFKLFILREKVPFSFDWDGMIERAAITYVYCAADFWAFALIPVIILVEGFWRVSLVSYKNSLFGHNEPGALLQQLLFKMDLGTDLLVSPLFAILVGMIF